MGAKYDLSQTINSNLSFGVGSEYKYDWGNFENNGSYEASDPKVIQIIFRITAI